MPNPINLNNSPLFKYLWTHEDEGLAHRGLDEVTPSGAAKLEKYALEHEADGSVSAPGNQVIDEMERNTMRAILEHPHYGAFFELDARPLVHERFGIDPGAYAPPPATHHPVDAGTIDIPKGVSQLPPSQLASAKPDALAKLFEKEYAQRKAYFEGQTVPAEERGRRTLGLLAAYAAALWAYGERPETERAGHALLDAFEKLPYAKAFGGKDFNGAGFSVAQSLVLGLDPNKFLTKFPEAFPTADTTYLSMSDKMASAMAFVDKYRAALGQPAKAEAFEKGSPLGFMLGEESGHYKRGNLDEKKPFSSSGLNWGKLLFPGDAEIAGLPPKSGFEFPIDCLDALTNFVVANPKHGDSMRVKDEAGNVLTVSKEIQKDDSGKAISWSAKFTNAAGEAVDPGKVLGVIVNSAGHELGDGKASGSQNMWWWGFCDRNTAQRLYKSKYHIPQLDAEVVKIKAGNQIIEIPREEAQKLIDADIPDIVTGETYCGFRFNDEPQRVKLKSGEVLTGKVNGLALEAGPGTRRLEGDYIAVHDAPGRPMLGTIDIDGTRYDVNKLVSLSRDPDSDKVTATFADGHWPKSTSGKLGTKVKWESATTVDGKQVLEQASGWPVRGDFEIQLAKGGTKVVNASEVSQIVGETQIDLRLSQYMVWVSQNRGMYATDGSTGVVVSNGMRWVNKLDLEEQSGDERPGWAPSGELKGIEGPLERQPGDKIVFVRGLYAYQQDQDPTSSNFAGWLQVSKSGRILNEGFTSGQPDFGWAANGDLNWLAKSSFNPYMDPKLRLAILVNGISDTAKLEGMAKDLNLPSNWKSYLAT